MLKIKGSLITDGLLGLLITGLIVSITTGLAFQKYQFDFDSKCEDMVDLWEESLRVIP